MEEVVDLKRRVFHSFHIRVHIKSLIPCIFRGDKALSDARLSID